MPELPEVETIRRGLERTIVGKTIATVEIRTPKLFPTDRRLINLHLRCARVAAVGRRGKVLLIELSSGWTLAIHLKMTGQLIVAVGDNQANSRERTANRIVVDPAPRRLSLITSRSNTVAFVGGHPEKVYGRPLPGKYTHIIIEFTDGTRLYYNDLRKFGWMKLLMQQAISDKRIAIRKIPTVDEFLDSLDLGPEPLGRKFTAPYLADLIRGRKVPIKQVLTDQKVAAGVGNIYADEALFRAGIHPRRPANSLKRRAIRKLHAAIRDVLKLGIEHGGTTTDTYRNVDGGPGRMRPHLKVYGREGKPCYVCGTPIERIKIGARSSYFCSKCQSK